MASWQSKFIKLVFKTRHLSKGHLTPKPWDENTSITAFREECESGAAKAKMAAGTEAVPVKVEGLSDGLAAEWIQPIPGGPISPNPDAVIFYVHGGAFVSGSCSDHRAIVSKLAAGTGMRMLLFEYRLAPEHPFPAGMEDILAAYRWLLNHKAPSERVFIVGESAGAGLCLAALLAMRDLGLPLPAAGVAMSPMTDMTLSGESYRTRLAASIDPPGMSEVCTRYYIGSNDPRNPWISPLFGDLRGLPPLMIQVGNDETMRDDSIRFAEKARAAEVDVILKVVEGQIHCFPLLPDFIPESKQAAEEIYAFLHSHARAAQPV